MRFSIPVAVALSFALSSLAAPLYVDEDGLALREENLDDVLALRAEDFEQALALRAEEILEALALRAEDFELDARNPTDWSTVPAQQKIKQPSGKLAPAAGKSNTHITYKQGGDSKKNPPVHTQHYQVWKPNPHRAGAMTDGGRWRGNDETGKTHGGISPPIWHPAGGEVKGKKAYQATASQNPPSYAQAKFSKSIKGAVAKMPKVGNPKGKSKDDLALNKGTKKPVVTSLKGSKSFRV